MSLLPSERSSAFKRVIPQCPFNKFVAQRRFTFVREKEKREERRGGEGRGWGKAKMDAN